MRALLRWLLGSSVPARVGALSALLAATPGCGDSAEPAPVASDAGPTGTLSLGRGAARVEAVLGPAGLDLRLVREGRVLARLDGQSLRLAAVTALSEKASYDPCPAMTGNRSAKVPEGFRWLPVVAVTAAELAGDELRLGLSHAEGARSTLTVREAEEGSFLLVLKPETEPPVAELAVAPVVEPAEAFYGLGETFDTVNHRGKVRAMQLELDGSLEGSNNEAHVPVPFFIGTGGWGLFVESPYPACFDMGAGDPGRVDAVFGTGAASGAGLRFHWFAAAHPLDVTRQYYAVTGLPRPPARWALGPLVWRDENRDQAEVEEDALRMRELDLATSAMWIDRPYATAVNTFDFDAPRFPEPAAMVARLHALGFRLALWHVPYLDESASETEALRTKAKLDGFYPEEHGLLLNKWGNLVDLTNPKAYAWWQGLVRRYTALGIEGFKLDYGEDIVPGLLGARNVWRFADGSDERTMHSRFQVLYHQAYRETLPAEGGFLLCRSGTYGDQVNGCVIWPGDLDASFARHGEVVTEGTKKYGAVGGLPASVIAGLSLGPSGFPFFGADTGGYRHSPPDKEVFVRWFEQTALSTVMQIGTSTNDVAWEPTPENGFDAETLTLYRRYTRLHLRLWPYLWSHVERLAVDGRAIQRPLGLAYPELGEHPSDTYLLGDALLVAPVVTRAERSRKVLLPPGEWLDWWTGAVLQGGVSATVAAPLDTLPLFLRRGGVVPLLRPTIDTLSPVAASTDIDSYATTPGRLYAVLAAPLPGERGEFVLFDGARLSEERLADGAVQLETSPGKEFLHGMQLEVLGLGREPAAVRDGSAPLPRRASVTELESTDAAGWVWVPEDRGGTLHLRVSGGAQRVTVGR